MSKEGEEVLLLHAQRKGHQLAVADSMTTSIGSTGLHHTSPSVYFSGTASVSAMTPRVMK